MNNTGFINYQGGKGNIIEFIADNISEQNMNDGKILDIFCGSGAVSSALLDKYDVISNDAEIYATTISKALSAFPFFTNFDIQSFVKVIERNFNEIVKDEKLELSIKNEMVFLNNKDLDNIIKLYTEYETVWNSPNKFVPSVMRNANKYNLFTRYYAGSYFGIKQAIEIDAIIKAIKDCNSQLKDVLFACLFYAIKENVYSRDGHMAQPLNFKTNSTRGFNTRIKSVKDFFLRKLNELIESSKSQITLKNHQVYNETLENILLNESLIKSVDVIYADPPYTDMQYSRYYHLLNIAVNYDFPEPTLTSKGFTKGLYTEGRFQSPLSQRGSAKKQLLDLVQVAKKYEKTLILSYAYPRNTKNQQTTRYTISIQELIELCSNVFEAENIEVKELEYTHANHRNSEAKLVIEYLIICKGHNNAARKNLIDISNVNHAISKIQPTNKNPVYNTHLYWSQKAFNITDYLIDNLTNKGDLIFDPFLGSGVTVLEAVKKGIDRKAIGCDINEMPLFITKTILTDAKNQKAIDDLEGLSRKIEQFQSLYQIVCPNCQKNALIDKVIFDKPVRNINNIQINQINVICDCGNKIVVDEQIFNQVESAMYAKYDYKYVDYNYRLLKNSKVAVLENDTIADIFTNRNLKALDIILELSQVYEQSSQNLIKYVINSMLHQCKITDVRSNSQWLLWIPKQDCVEKNVFSLLQHKIKKFISACKVISNQYENSDLVYSFDNLSDNKAFLLQKGSQNITNHDLPDNSVDLIITDPPYLEQVLYSEYMQLYKPIVGLDYNLKDEIVVSSAKNRNKTKDLYYKSLEDVFIMCGQKLKKDKLLCLYFHDSDLMVWDRLIGLLYRAGFEFIGQTHIKKSMTLKNIISPKKSLNGDSILFFNNMKRPIEFSQGKETIDVIEKNLIAEARHMIMLKGNLSTPELYDMGLMTVLIQNGWLTNLAKKYKSLVDIFEKNLKWDAKTAKWSIDI